MRSNFISMLAGESRSGGSGNGGRTNNANIHAATHVFCHEVKQTGADRDAALTSKKHLEK